MDGTKKIELSKYLSFVLRHSPQAIGLPLDEHGWADVDELIHRSAQAGRTLTPEALQDIVAASDKKRFTLSADGRRIRAAQGHSMPVELGLAPLEPPLFLFHGTSRTALTSIFQDGLRPLRRQHVHLSLDPQTAKKVGARHGKPVVLHVRAGDLYRSGTAFYRADNGVWLTRFVPSDHLSLEPQ